MMPFAISMYEEPNNSWRCFVVCSGAEAQNFYAKSAEEARALGKKYLDDNYFSLSNDEVNARVAKVRGEK
jgi:hypothetical protein